MKKFAVVTTLLTIPFFLIVTNSIAFEMSCFGPQKYVRTKGAPNQFSDVFPGVAGEGTLIIYNGDEQGKNLISSATIDINGARILSAKDFKQKADYIEVPIPLQEQNTIDVKLNSKPNSFLKIEILQEIEAEAAAVIGPDGGVVKIVNHGSFLYGTKIIVPEGALLDNKIVTIEPGNLPQDYPDFIDCHSTTVELGREGVTFSKDIMVTMPYKESEVDENQHIFVLWYDRIQNVWYQNSTLSVDKEKNLVSFTTDHFSSYTVMSN